MPAIDFTCPPVVDPWRDYARCRPILEKNRLTAPAHRAAMEVFIETFSHIPPESRVLDVGCGGGLFLELLRNLGFEDIRGIDASDAYVARAKKKNLKVEQKRAEEINNHGDFDIIVCTDLMEHLTMSPVRSFYRALTKQGLFYTSVPVYDSFQDRFRRRIRGMTRMDQAREHDETHVKAYTPRSFVSEVCSNGFILLWKRLAYNPWPRLGEEALSRRLGRWVHCGRFCIALFQKKENHV